MRKNGSKRKDEPGEEGPYVKVKTAAARLSLSPGTLRNKLSRGEFPREVSVRIGGARRIYLPALLAFIEKLRQNDGDEAVCGGRATSKDGEAER
ncbi:MAG: helix-turn-helix domain-containing protein [Candidatus Methylomirabilota bacterium]